MEMYLRPLEGPSPARADFLKIELESGTAPVSRVLYRLAPAEMAERTYGRFIRQEIYQATLQFGYCIPSGKDNQVKNALGGHMSNVSGTKEVHEFTGTFSSLRLCGVTVNGETYGLGTLKQAVLLWRIRQAHVSVMALDSSDQSQRKGEMRIVIASYIVRVMLAFARGSAAVFVYDQPGAEVIMADQMMSDQSKLGGYRQRTYRNTF
ncbi:hypothetical protein YC2023_039967 [Brassica napus]